MPSDLRHIARDARRLPRLHQICFLLGRWNRATAPYVLRTDEEHAACRKYARAIDARLKRLHAYEGEHWTELSTGYRMPL